MTTGLRSPPGRLPTLEDDHVAVLPECWELLRLHRTGGAHPMAAHELRWFGPLPDKGRFDHHPPGAPRDHEPDHGIAYLACDDPGSTRPHELVAQATSVPGNPLEVAVAEAAQGGRELIVADGLTLSVLELTEPLRVLDVRGRFAQQTRAGTHLSTAPHPQTQRWARRIHDQYRDLAGVLYAPSTGGPAVAVALFERAAAWLAHARVQLSRRLDDPVGWDLASVAAHAVNVDLVEA